MYPILVKNYLKIVPALGLGFYIMSLVPIIWTHSNLIYHDRNPRSFTRSFGTTRLLRTRGEKDCNNTDPLLDY